MLSIENSRSKLPLISVVGTSRSGKTLMVNCLSVSPKVFAFRELHFFGSRLSTDLARLLSFDEAVEQYAQHLDFQENGILSRLGTHAYIGLARKHLEANAGASNTPIKIYERFMMQYVNDHKPNALPCEQSGSYVYFIEEIQNAFPAIRIICMIRDPRLVLSSKKRKWNWANMRRQHWPLREWFRQKAQYHPWILARNWSSASKKAMYAKTSPAVRVQSFELLVRQPEEQLREVCEFLEIDFVSTMCSEIRATDNEMAQAPARTPDEHRQTIRECEALGISPTELFIVQFVSAHEMNACGYEHWPVRPNWIMLFFYFVTLPIVLVGAVVANFGRLGNLVDAIRRRLVFQ